MLKNKNVERQIKLGAAAPPRFYLGDIFDSNEIQDGEFHKSQYTLGDFQNHFKRFYGSNKLGRCAKISMGIQEGYGIILKYETPYFYSFDAEFEYCPGRE